MAVIDAKANGIGDKHPSMIAASSALARFKETHPAMPDSIWRRLAEQRLAQMQERLAGWSDSGLGEAHPTFKEQQIRIRALAELIGTPVVAEADGKAAVTSKPAPDKEQIAVEDLALRMMVAIREKDDATLKSLAADRIKGWRDALRAFAVEVREHFRQFTGSESFDMRAGESLVDGDLAVVRCTGPAALQGKCLVLFFVKTDDGWRNHSLRNSTVETPLATLLADLKKRLENK
jgi:hypothetical protein